MEYRYHPILENVKVNEDGSVILKNGVPVNIVSDQLPHMKKPRKLVYFNLKGVNTIRLVCEAWHGLAPTGEHAARRIDEEKGDHYSNLYWGKKGHTLNSAKGVPKPGRKMTIEVYNDIVERAKLSSVKKVLKELEISEMTFYRYRKKYVEKE